MPQQGWSLGPCAAMGPTEPGPPTGQQLGLGLSLSPGKCPVPGVGLPWCPPGCPTPGWGGGMGPGCQALLSHPREPPWLWVPGPEGAPVPRSSLAGTLGNIQSGSCSSSCIPDPEVSRGDASFPLLMLGGWDDRALPPVPLVLGRPAAETVLPQALGEHGPNTHQDLQHPEDFLQLSFRLADRCASDQTGK